MTAPRTLVVALGGNAISRAGDDGTITAQYARATEAMRGIADLVLAGDRVVLTHGNGPVVGNIVLRGELASAQIPPTPLYISGADSEGGIGFMLQQVLGNELWRRGCELLPVTIVSQVEVDASDPAFSHPTKPIGMYYSAEEARQLTAERGWQLVEEPGRGWRRVVASPRPLRVFEAPAVATLLEAGFVPIAAGGGGVPVFNEPDGTLTGIDAVIDKDWASAVLANELHADLLVILMEADAVYEGWGTSSQRRIDSLNAAEATALAATLPQGSVGPKLAASAWLAERGGTALICRPENLADALAGRAGTRVTGS